MSELEATYLSFRFPDWIQVRLLEANEKVDDTLAEGWEPFYLKHFEIDVRFSIMGLVEELYIWIEIHFSQLVLATVRLLLCVDRLKEKHNLEFSVKDLFYSYFVKRENLDTRHFVLNARPHGRILVSGFSSNER